MRTLTALLIAATTLIFGSVHADALDDANQWQKARQKECGKDYARPHIGMTIERANYCSGVFKYSRYSVSNTATGKITTYKWGRYLVDSNDGKIIAITSFR